MRTLSRQALLRVTLLFAPLALQIIIFKVWKLRILAERVTAHGVMSAIRWDLLAILISYTLFLVLLQFSSGRWRKLWTIGTHVFVFGMMVVFSLGHGFFLKTGSVGQWTVLKNSIYLISDVSKLLPGVINFKYALLVLVPPILNLAPVYIERLGFVRRWLEASPNPPANWPAYITSLAFLVGLNAYLFPPHTYLAGAERPLAHNTVVHIAGDIVKELFAKEKKYHIPQDKSQLFNTHHMRLRSKWSTKRMNVVLIVLESTRNRSLTPYNPKMPTTPFLNKLAKKSLVVERMHTVIPHTSKALVPIFCGIYPRITRRTPEGEVNGIPAKCLPRLLREQGYQTAFFQPATTTFEGRAQLLENMGFETIRGHEDMKNKGFAKTNYFGYEDRIMFKPSLKWLDKAIKRRRPFFLSFLTLVSHHTYTTPPAFKKKKYTDSKDPELNNYLNSLYYQDQFLKDLFAAFKKRGLYKNTLFVMVGDHGEAFNEHRRRQHDNIMWQEGLRVPFFLFSPSHFKKGRRLKKGLWQQVDILPTVTELLGYKMTGGIVPGRSLLSKPDLNRTLRFSCWYEKYCMAKLHKQRKTIYHYGRRSIEVYDLASDPMERNDLNAKGQLYKTTEPKKLKKELLSWRDHINWLYTQAAQIRKKRNVQMTEPKVEFKVNIRFGPYIRLVGYNLKTKTLRRGNTLDITYVFQALKKIPRAWDLFFHIELKRPYKFLNADHTPVEGTYPVAQWKPKEYIIDHHRMRIPKNFPKGKLRILLGMWARKKPRQPILGAHGRYRDAGKRNLRLVEIPLTD